MPKTICRLIKYTAWRFTSVLSMKPLVTNLINRTTLPLRQWLVEHVLHKLALYFPHLASKDKLRHPMGFWNARPYLSSLIPLAARRATLMFAAFWRCLRSMDWCLVRKSPWKCTGLCLQMFLPCIQEWQLFNTYQSHDLVIEPFPKCSPNWSQINQERVGFQVWNWL